MTHGSLFSGIGGFDLAAQWMGWQNVFHCEWNEFGQKVLHHYWPEAELFTDITKSDFKKYNGSIDIISGGFPCQPYSSAGKRLGKEDDRHLWPEMLRVIREVRPRWVVGENVLGLVNWNGGLVFHEVQTDLEAEGYEVQPYVLPAAAVGAPHRRDRVWFVANAKNVNAYRCSGDTNNKQSVYKSERKEVWCKSRSNGTEGITTNTDLYGRNERNCKHEIHTSERGVDAQRNIEPGNVDGDATDTGLRSNGLSTKGRLDMGGELLEGREWQEKADGSYNIGSDALYANSSSEQGEYIQQPRERKSNRPNSGNEFDRFEKFPTVAPICYGDDGISNRLDSITFPKWRNESIKAGGNAVVPQVVYQIFKTIQEYENKYL